MTIAERRFEMADQQRFAMLSGDHNPMHVDAVAARRTVAGEPVVHGLHLMLWGLDALAIAEPGLPPPNRLRADFNRFVTLGEPVTAAIHKRSEAAIQLRLSARGTIRCELTVGFGETPAAPPAIEASEIVAPATDPIDLPLEEMSGRRGLVPFATPPAAIAEAFPALARWIGAVRVAALAATTRLVGMIYPGLNSLYAGLKVDLVGSAGDHLAFAMEEPRHRMMTAQVQGGGIAGQLNSVMRMPPTPQPPLADLKGLIAPDGLAGHFALIVGGSRGLGELAAKLVASGGGKVAITYRVGRDEAETVAAEIRAAGGQCETLPYRIGEPAGPQLAALGEAPTHAYYFATPVIARPNSAFFDAARLRDLERYFVEGFWDLAATLRERRPALRLFYPSTVFIDERPRGMAEYAMAKAAGELLCAEIEASLAPTTIVVRRLPKMLTDQTAGPLAGETADPVATLLDVVQAMHAR